MSEKYFIPLQEIDTAIRMNCVIEKNAIKPLTLAKEQKIKNKGIGRCLFIFLAVRCGYNGEQICDYLSISADEFAKKRHAALLYHRDGKELFVKPAATIPAANLKETSLFFYRKLILVSNYLRYRYNFQIERD